MPAQPHTHSSAIVPFAQRRHQQQRSMDESSSDSPSTPTPPAGPGLRESAAAANGAVAVLGAVGAAEAGAGSAPAAGGGDANGTGTGGEGYDERAAAPSGSGAVAHAHGHGAKAEASSGGAPSDPIAARTGTGTGTGAEADEDQQEPRARARPSETRRHAGATPPPARPPPPLWEENEHGLRRVLAEREAELAALQAVVGTLTGRAEAAEAEAAELRGRLAVAAGICGSVGLADAGAADGGRGGGSAGGGADGEGSGGNVATRAAPGGATAGDEAKGSGAAAAKRRRRGNGKSGATAGTDTDPSSASASASASSPGSRKIKHDLRPVIPHHTAVPRPATDDVLPNDRSKYADQWRRRFAELVSFKLRYNHTSVPKDYNVNPALSHWVQKQRHRRRSFDADGGNAGHLTQERIDALDSIGFEWNPGRHRRDDVWEMRFRQLIEYKRQHGHCNVPEKYPQSRQLGKWVGNQRHRKKLLDAGRVARGMNKARVEKLEAVGFEWIRKRGGGIGGGDGGGDGGGGGDSSGINVAAAVGGGPGGAVGVDPSGNAAAVVDAGAAGDEGIIGDVDGSHQYQQHQQHQQHQHPNGDEGLREGQAQVQIGGGGLHFDGVDVGVGVHGGSNAAHAAVPAGTVVAAAAAAANLDGARHRQGVAAAAAAAVAEVVAVPPPPPAQVGHSHHPPSDLVQMAAEGGTVHVPELHHVQAVRVVQEAQPEGEDGGAEVGVRV